MARSWARIVLWMLARLCGLNYVVEGRERIPPGNHIVMSKHTSAWETVAQFVIFPPQVWVLKRELLWIPFVGWGLKLLRPIAINRGAGHRAVEPGHRAGQGAARARAVGHHVSRRHARRRRRDSQVRRERRAAGDRHRQDSSCRCRTTPATFWPRRGILKKPGTIRVIIGEPILAAGKNARDLNEEIREAIDSGMARIEQGA